jgi:glycosyltransferase involved in cell wall biosynthesis
MKRVNSVIVCNDGSTDMTGEIARTLGAEVITHERNLGYGASLAELFLRAREAGAAVVVTIDGDERSAITQVVKPILDGVMTIDRGSGRRRRTSTAEVGHQINRITNGGGVRESRSATPNH